LISNIIGHVYDGYIRWKEKRLGHSIPTDETITAADMQEDK